MTNQDDEMGKIQEIFYKYNPKDFTAYVGGRLYIPTVICTEIKSFIDQAEKRGYERGKREELELTLKYLRDNYEGCIEGNEYQKGFKHGIAMMVFQLEKAQLKGESKDG